jgi:hypothetical protein
VDRVDATDGGDAVALDQYVSAIGVGAGGAVASASQLRA